MSSLLDIIRDLIAKNGPLTIADYMRLALQHPEHGYYRKGDPLGQGGDFITAPEISQMFGEMIGLWCAEVWRGLGSPGKFTLLELGPGRGTLMQDALRATAKIPGFHAALELGLFESSETLRAMQEDRLRDYYPLYIDDLTALPPQPTLIIANEFFDALPIRQFEQGFTGWCERRVTVMNGALIFALQPLSEVELRLIPPALHETKPGAVYEVSHDSLVIFRTLTQQLAAHGGAALITDYGYAKPDYIPSLQAVADHKYADVLSRPGETDLTALVDFGALKALAQADAKLRVYGPVGQGEFLQNLGIELRANQLKARATPEQFAAIDAALQRLTDTAQMGSLFKALAVTAGSVGEVPGF